GAEELDPVHASQLRGDSPEAANLRVEVERIRGRSTRDREGRAGQLRQGADRVIDPLALDQAPDRQQTSGGSLRRLEREPVDIDTARDDGGTAGVEAQRRELAHLVATRRDDDVGPGAQ